MPQASDPSWWKFPKAFAFWQGYQDSSHFRRPIFRKGFITLTDLDDTWYMEGYHAGMWFDHPGEEPPTTS